MINNLLSGPGRTHQAGVGRRRWYSTSPERRAYEAGYRSNGGDESALQVKNLEIARAYWAGVYDRESELDARDCALLEERES